MTDGKVQAARKLLASGTPPHEVAHSLGVSVPTLYRWVPVSARTYALRTGGWTIRNRDLGLKSHCARIPAEWADR
jgi:hypothetical protein